MKNQKKLQIKKETVEILKSNLSQQLKGGSQGEITVLSRTCGDATKICGHSQNPCPTNYTCNTCVMDCPTAAICNNTQAIDCRH